MPRPKLSNEQLLSRLLDNVQPTGGPDECWPWTGTKLKNGFPVFPSGDRLGSRYPHILLIRIMREDEFDPAAVWRRKCNNETCVKPAHWHRVGTRRRVTRLTGDDDDLKDIIEGAVATNRVAGYEQVIDYCRAWSEAEVRAVLERDPYLKRRFLT